MHKAQAGAHAHTCYSVVCTPVLCNCNTRHCVLRGAPQALFAREDQAGGRKRVGANVLSMFSGGATRMVAKARLRLSTLPANAPLNLSLPMQGELARRLAMRA